LLIAFINNYVAVIGDSSSNSFSPGGITLNVPTQCSVQRHHTSSVLLQKLQMVKLT